MKGAIRVGLIGAKLWGAGLWGPAGLEGLAALTTPPALSPGWREALPPAPARLPANERRRASPAIRAALAAAEAALAAARMPGTIEAVFASSNGEGAAVGALLEALTAPPAQVSPTLFHNSVHNAAAGHFAIAWRSHAALVSLAAHDETVAAGLLRAAARLAARPGPLLFTAFDAPLPPPLDAKRRTDFPFAFALVLAPERPAASSPSGEAPSPEGPSPEAPSPEAAIPLARLAFSFHPAPAPLSLPRAPGLAALVPANPAAAGLALLEALAGREARALTFPLGGGHLRCEIIPPIDHPQ
jgi:hypothetical protein